MSKKKFLPNQQIVDSNFTTEEDFASLFEETNQNSNIEGTVVKATIVAIENGIAVLDAGLKSEATVSLKEFATGADEAEVSVGDTVDVYVEQLESRDGRVILSREKAIREEAWKNLETLSEEGSTVEGTMFGRVKGGFVVDIKGVVAFLPGSQVDIRPIKDVTPLLGIKQPFQILKMDKKQGNVVVSRRAIIEESRQEARDELLAQIKEGQTMQGIVKNITDYGAFIDLGSIDGLLHVTDISWSRISHPSEVLSIGQELDVQIIKYNPETKRISLGVKQLGDNPWDGIDTKYSIGTKHTGTVSNITDYGAFVELEEGVEGLVHVSEISWTKTNVHPRKLVQIGDEVEIAILDIDVAKHRISLGIKQCKDNPWKNFADNNKVGDIVEGQVRNVVDFGLFVGLDDEIDGLVHLSDISWASESDKLLKDFNKNDATKVKILAIDIDKQRISLGIKQLDSDPLGDVFSDLEKGATVTCTITDVHDDGIDVVVKDKLPCFIKRNDLAMDRVEQRTARFAVGERVDAKIVKIEKDKRNLSLSIRALEESEHKAAIKEYGSVDSGASLGDILGLAMNKAKNEDN